MEKILEFNGPHIYERKSIYEIREYYRYPIGLCVVINEHYDRYTEGKAGQIKHSYRGMIVGDYQDYICIGIRTRGGHQYNVTVSKSDLYTGNASIRPVEKRR